MSEETIPQSAYLQAVGAVMLECYVGYDQKQGTWFTDPEARNGILGLVAEMDHTQANGLIGYPADATVAGHLDHLWYALNLVNRESQGEQAFATANWQRNFALTVTAEEWQQLIGRLRVEYEGVVGSLKTGPWLLDPDMLTGMMGVIAHGAMHLGMIRAYASRIGVRS